MLDRPQTGQTVRHPTLAICGYDSSDLTLLSGLEIFERETQTGYGRAMVLPPQTCTSLIEHLRGSDLTADVRAILLVGRTRNTDHIHLQMRAENAAPRSQGKLVHNGPAMARSTAPITAIVEALKAEGFEATATSHEDNDQGSALLYSSLTALEDRPDALPIGLMRVPENLDSEGVARSVRIASDAIGRTVSPVARDLRG